MRIKSAAPWSTLLVAMLLSILLSACGGDSKPDQPTSTAAPMPTRAATSPSSNATPASSPQASPVGSPQASPEGSPAPFTSGASTITRAEFKNSLLAAFPIDTAVSKGGSVVLGSSGDISTTNPLLASDGTTINIMSQVFEPLLGASPIDGRPIPALADSWTVSADELTYTFKLNTAAKWQDGVDITADDVAFSFDAVLNPNLNSQYRSQVREVVKSYRVVDPDTFEITASDRFVTFLYYAPGSVFIVPKHIWGEVPVEQWSFDGGSTGEDPSRIVGSGPFTFKSWDQGQRVTLARNQNYYDTVPNIDEFVMVVIPESDTLVRSLEAGDIDTVEILPAPDTERIKNTPGLAVDVYDFYSITYYITNMSGSRSPALGDQRVRQAMYQAIDRDAITSEIFLGFGKSATGTQPPLSPAYAPDQMQPAYAYDPDAARKLLADAGWTDTDGNGWVDKDGKSLKLTMTFSGDDATVEALLANLQDSWKNIGIDVELDNVDGSVLEQRLLDRDFDLSLILFELTPDGSQGNLFTCANAQRGFNFSGYCNPAYDALDAQQLREFDPAKRVHMQIQLSQLVWTDLPVGPIRFGVKRTGYNTRMHNFFPNGYGFLWSLPFVWVDSGS